MSLLLKHGLKLSQKQLEQLSLLENIFIQKNTEINLSAIRDPEGIQSKHFVDSLLATKHINFQNKNILDIGAGGGFPCLPLAIATPQSTFSALDSVGKKMNAVQEMADTLGLNVKTFHGRIEDFGHDQNFREQFDIVTARALAPWPVLLEYALPFVHIGGFFVAYQGPAIYDDLKTHKGLEKILGGTRPYVYEDQLETEEKRIFVVIKKEHATPKKYPRKNGVPRKSPLTPPSYGKNSL